jgi:hypothetical protein
VAKRLLLWAVVGAALGTLVGAVSGISLITYWASPLVGAEQDRCVGQVNAALVDMARLQGISAAVGLVAFLILGIWWSRRRSGKAESVAAPK